ncbi:C40 family peptidase [Brevundimonas sp. G8]|uniref:C40 family peptidase n=1 Tax=Brevundimonas sp. G8 TaxID=1350776 RepID=UPI0012F0467E|nr:NlpC/P60 family protein [Brevundimonas sp. G8]VXC02839.1 putative endopeptidase Spr [Brevundimonas sp. G8]
MTDVLDLLPPGDRLARPDLAEQALEGLVRAGAYRATEAMHCRAAVADILSDEDGRIDQLLHGEIFDVLDRANGRAWGRARRDGVVGWVVLDSLSSGAPLATYRVAAVDAALPLNALVIEAADLAEGALRPVGEFETDLVAVAERLLGRPHELGARSSISTDCSGLVQQALLACGLPGPRRSDAQAQLGRAVSSSDIQRGDIVVWLAPTGDQDWTGHSALMLDGERIIHATGGKGVVIEPLAEVEARLIADGFAAAVFRRL